MKRVLLLDFQKDLSSPIRKSVTGTFGSKTEVGGIIGSLYTKKKNSGPIIPPLYLAYAAAIFSEHNYHVSYAHNFSNRDIEYDIILFASSMPGSADEIKALKHFRSHNTSKILILGAFAKEKPELYLPYCDGIVVDGEPEDFLIDLASGEQEISVSKKLYKKLKSRDISTYPFPKWDMFSQNFFNYSPIFKNHAVPFITTRGCPYNCDYCHYMPEAGPVLRQRTLENIASELHDLKQQGVKNIVFRDLVFTINKRRTIDLCKILKEFDFQWAIETRLDKLNIELINTMKASGLKHVNLGIESPSAETLRNVGRKPTSLKHQEEIIHYLQKNNITVSAFFIIGFVDDTKESIEHTINYAKKLNTFAAQFCVMTPFPGTELYNNLKDRILHNDWSQFTEYRPTLKLDHLSNADIIHFRDMAYRQYYLRIKWLLKYWSKLL